MADVFRTPDETIFTNPGRVCSGVGSEFVAPLDRVALDPDGYMTSQVLSQHSGVASVLLVRRRWDRNVQRYRYMYRLFRAAEDTNAAGLVRALTSWEDEHVVPARIAS